MFSSVAMMRLQQNRYLWVHFAGLAFVPLLLDICLAGLASAGPALAFKGQFWAIALLGILPGLAMQWLKPFYIFSLPPSALKPAALSEDQRRCLQIFKSWQIKALAIGVAVFSLWLLAQVYGMTPQVSPVFTAKAGLVIGAIAFFVAATFMQISVSAGRALLISPQALKRVAAVDVGAIASDFLILGVRVNKLLPDISTQVPANQPVSDINKSAKSKRESKTVAAEAAPPSVEKEIVTEQPEQAAIKTSDEVTELSEPAAGKESEVEVVIPEKLPLDKEEDFQA
ncbi:MAG: low-complexity tail membrane protein [Phormidesmis sp.]